MYGTAGLGFRSAAAGARKRTFTAFGLLALLWGCDGVDAGSVKGDVQVTHEVTAR